MVKRTTCLTSSLFLLYHLSHMTYFERCNEVVSTKVPLTAVTGRTMRCSIYVFEAKDVSIIVKRFCGGIVYNVKKNN